MTAITQQRALFPYTGRRYGFGAAPGIPALSLTAPRLVQRGATTGALNVSGTYTAGYTVQVKVFLSADNSTVVDWADVDAPVSGGVWDGTVTIPTGGPYYCQARLLDVSDVVLVTTSSSNALICGDVFMVLGQSNAVGFGTSNQTYSGSSVCWLVRESGTFDTTLNDPSSDAGGGSFVPLLATLVSAYVGSSVPIVFVKQAVTATALVASGAEWAYPTGAQWILADARVDGLNLNGIKGVLWLQGERDVSFSVTQDSYRIAEAALAAAVNDWPGEPPLISNLTGHQSAETDSEMDAIRLAKITNWTNGTTRYGANTIDINLADSGGDGIHFKTDAELAELAGRTWLAVKGACYSGAHARGPQLRAATRVGAVITGTMDQPLETATTYTTSAWIVKDAGTPVSVVSIAKAGTDQIVWTLAAPPTGAVTLTFGSGDDAIGATIPRALTVTLPATINGISSVSIPAEPVIDYVVPFETPEFMHGTIAIRPHLIGAIYARPHLSGKVLASPYLHGEIGLNP